MTNGGNLQEGERPRNRPVLRKQSHSSFQIHPINAYNPDSETMVLSSALMYRKGFPTGGL